MCMQLHDTRRANRGSRAAGGRVNPLLCTTTPHPPTCAIVLTPSAPELPLTSPPNNDSSTWDVYATFRYVPADRDVDGADRADMAKSTCNGKKAHASAVPYR